MIKTEETLVDSLYKAVKNNFNGMHMMYHPQINIDKRELIGAEALLRWETDGAIIPPSKFIVMAEQIGLIQEIGFWAIEQACQECTIWNASRPEDAKLRISVNVSVMQLENGFAARIEALLKKLNFPAYLLDLEITESYLKTQENIAVLHELHAQGIKLSMDDFGTGYSCLADIRILPFHTIKIDREFVRHLQHGCHASYHIVEAIIKMARNMGMDTLAEGIENVEQMIILFELGCYKYQGYMFALPLNSHAMREFIIKETWQRFLLQKNILSYGCR